MRRLLQLVSAIVVSTALSAQSQESASKWVSARTTSMRASVSAKGTFEAHQTTEIKADTKTWTQLKISRVVPEGSTVKAGQAVIWFETSEYEKKLRESRFETELARLALEEAEIDFDQFAKIQEIDKKLAAASLAKSREDFDYFLEVDRQRRIKSAEFSLKSARGSLENAEEELEQLQKMYREDELTEESEEIVLKRARRAVESSRFSLESAELRTKRTLSVLLPREQQEMQDALARSELTAQKSDLMWPIAAKKTSLEREKARFAYQKQKDAFDKLSSDGDRLVLRAESDGVVYYGQSTAGKWTGGGAGTTRSLKAGQSVTASGVLITIVNPALQKLRIPMNEKDIGKIAPGQKLKIRPTAFPNRSLEGAVATVSLIPDSSGKFLTICDFDGGGVAVMPGMTADTTVFVYQNDRSVVIPKDAVREENGDQFVEVMNADGRTVKRTVSIGFEANGSVEILQGIVEGEKVRVPPDAAE